MKNFIEEELIKNNNNYSIQDRNQIVHYSCKEIKMDKKKTIHIGEFGTYHMYLNS